MILKSLILHNFGLYGGNHVLDFSGTTSNYPIILIGGMNGRGKTTILEAILLALYGRHSFGVVTSKLTYPNYLSKFICSTNQEHNTFIELVVKMSEDEPDLKIRRSWNDLQQPIIDSFQVEREGKIDLYLSENWETFMENILPVGVSQLFFFDGEKITKFANDETDEGLKNAIRTLLGIDTVERLIYDLNRVIYKQTKDDVQINQDKNIGKLKNKIEELANDKRELEIKLNKLNKKIEKNKKKYSQIEERIIKNGGSLFLKKSQMEEQILRLNRDLQESNSFLVDTAAGPAPFAIVKPLLDKILRQLYIETEIKKQEIISEQILALQQEVTCFMFNRLNHNALEELNELFGRYLPDKQSEKNVIFNALPENIKQLEFLCNTYLSDTLKTVNNVVDIKKTKLKEKKELEGYIESIQNEQEIETLYLNKEQLNETRIALEAKKRLCEENRVRLEREYEMYLKELRDLKQEVLRGEKDKIREARIAQYASFSIEIMGKYKLRLQEKKVYELSVKINERFQRLVGKEKLIQNIKIDPVTLDIIIMNLQGEEFSKTKLSAGERQMLAIAMLWGISSCLEVQLPMIVDTPLARLDSVHRENFVKQYLPNVGEQVIVLSTDEEIYGPYMEMLKPYIASEYLLKYDVETCETHIEQGYF